MTYKYQVLGSKGRTNSKGQPIRRSAKETSIKTLAYLNQKLSVVTEPRDACLVALLYLSGRRIGEVLELKKRDFTYLGKHLSFKTLNEKVYRQKPQSEFTFHVEGVFFRADPKTKEKIEYHDRYYQEIHPEFSLTSPSGKLLGHYVTDYLEKLDDMSYVFKHLRGGGVDHIRYSMGLLIVRYILPDLWPHFLRHNRFTHLAQAFKDDPFALHRVTFHKRMESTMEYVHEEKTSQRLDEV